MARVVALFAVLSLYSIKATATTYVYFSPNGGCEQRIVQLLDGATETIKAVVYAVNNPNIVNALKRARSRGVSVQLLTDRLQAFNKSSSALELRKYPIDIKIHSWAKIEHNKFVVVDGRYLETGSFNWTGPAQNQNSENCMFMDAKRTVYAFAQRFEQLWSLNSREKSEEYFRRINDRLDDF